MKLPRLLVTGANGFVGKALCSEAVRRGFAVKGAVRRQVALPAGVTPVLLDDIRGLPHILQDVEVMIHLAARVHVMREHAADPLALFRQVNVQATEELARRAAASGVRRFVFVSSIKVNGEETQAGKRFSERDQPQPADPYGTSKWEAEQVLRRVAAETGLEVLVLRPPLLYGPGVKGNFAQMMRALRSGIPLPLASIVNQRSLLYLGNFVDALLLCATHPGGAGKTYLLCDGDDVSTPELLRQLAAAMGRKICLLPVPLWLLRFAGWAAGRSAPTSRLLGSLQVDGSLIENELGWRPPYSLEQGLIATVCGTDGD